jgi:hypothetical protein
MHGIDEGELEIGHSGYYASSLLYWQREKWHATFGAKETPQTRET